jgi:hypothetical protein
MIWSAILAYLKRRALALQCGDGADGHCGPAIADALKAQIESLEQANGDGTDTS